MPCSATSFSPIGRTDYTFNNYSAFALTRALKLNVSGDLNAGHPFHFIPTDVVFKVKAAPKIRTVLPSVTQLLSLESVFFQFLLKNSLRNFPGHSPPVFLFLCLIYQDTYHSQMTPQKTPVTLNHLNHSSLLPLFEKKGTSRAGVGASAQVDQRPLRTQKCDVPKLNCMNHRPRLRSRSPWPHGHPPWPCAVPRILH